MILSIDFETASRADLRKTGAYAYARDTSTRVLCMAWAFDDEPVSVWDPSQPFPERIIDHVRRLRTVKGWNILFEFVIWNFVLRRLLPELPELDLAQLDDTMAAAAYWGLPLKLEDAAKAARVGQLKDDVGHALMLRMARPRSEAGGVVTWWHETDPDKYARLKSYCGQDVNAERAVGRAVGRVPELERRIWQLDARMNMRGVGIDMDLVNRLRTLATKASLSANDLLRSITNGAVDRITNAKGLLAYLQANTGYPYDNLRKGVVEARLQDISQGPSLERDVLELRADTAKTSAAKLQAMVLASDAPYTNGVPRVRGMLQYYGATRTGRWAGRLIQLQNLPRGSVKFIAEAIQAILDGAHIPILEALFGPVMGIVSSALRGCIIAAEGNDLVVADFSQIEARVLPWLAGQQDILDVFASGEDVYVYTAQGIGSDSRQLGKVLVLACGFGMSAEKFQATAAAAPYFVHLTYDEAERAVSAWRRANRHIVSLWRRYENAARAVVSAWQNTGTATTVDVGQVRFGMYRGHLLIRLPSGRELVYRDAEIRDGRFGPAVCYMGQNQYTRQWERVWTYGGKIAENVTQAVARDLMAHALIEADAAGLDPLLLVHDELIAEQPKERAKAALQTLLTLMRRGPAWAAGLPLDAAGWFGPRYKK